MLDLAILYQLTDGINLITTSPQIPKAQGYPGFLIRDLSNIFDHINAIVIILTTVREGAI